MQSVNVHAIVANSQKIECVSCHYAVTYRHHNNRMSVFWDLQKAASVLRGRNVGKYPLLGLGELGNVTSSSPLLGSIMDAWPTAFRDVVLVTYAQAYTPLLKPMDSKPFADHLFLISHLLGRNYIRSHSTFRHIAECTEGMKEYRALHEAILTMLHRAEARMEFVVTSRYMDSVAMVNLSRLAEIVKNEDLLVQVSCVVVVEVLFNVFKQVPCTDILHYAQAVVQELFDPLEASFTGVFLSRESMATILLCETLLGLLPSMSVRDMPYELLKQYQIAPLGSGVIQRENRILLSNCATVDRRGLLTVPVPLIQKVFLPMVEMPSSGRRQVLRLMEFLDKVRVNDRDEISQKAASVLVQQFLDDLVRTGQVARHSALHQARVLVDCGGGVDSVVSALVYTQKVFDLRVLPARDHLHSFLSAALSFASSSELLSATAAELLRKVTFVPRAVHHESAVTFISTSFHVLSRTTIVGMKTKAGGGILTEDDCTPLLKATQVTLLREFEMTHHKATELTK